MIALSQSAPCQQGVLRLAVVGACYYIPPKLFPGLVERFVKLLGPGIEWVDYRYAQMQTSGDDTNAHAREDHWVMAQGDFLDISAYASAADNIEDCDLYLVMNDTLFTKHYWQGFAHGVSPSLQSLASMPAPAAVGEIHPSTDLLLLDLSNPTRKHLSTFCFVLNRRGFELFQSLLRSLPPDGSDELIQDWLEQQIQSHPALGLLLHVHLFGPRNPWSWRSLGQNTRSRLLLRKAVTVTFEYLFSVRLLQEIGMIMPINCRISYRIRSKLASLCSRFTRR
jgi:hypothetical protein